MLIQAFKYHWCTYITGKINPWQIILHMNCIIVEDNELAVHSLKKCIARSGNLNVDQIFQSGEEALAYLETASCDLIFLDIEMPGMSGMELIGQLTSIPYIVIISSKKEFAAEAYNFDVADYIVKPLTFERFQKAIQKVLSIQGSVTDVELDYFYLKETHKMSQVYFKDILYVEALADYVHIHTPAKRYTVLSTMKAIENRFPKKDFLRVHRSYIVRLDKIKEIEDNTVSINSKLIPVSRVHKEEFMRKIKII
jgi:DNA-binding LytR/AlgR family response regulator